MPVVEIYTKMLCGYCWRAKNLLQRKGVEFEEIAVDGDKAAREAMIRRAHGRTTVPQIFIDGRHIGGCSDLFELDADGRLDEMIAA